MKNAVFNRMVGFPLTFAVLARGIGLYCRDLLLDSIGMRRMKNIENTHKYFVLLAIRSSHKQLTYITTYINSRYRMNDLLFEAFAN